MPHGVAPGRAPGLAQIRVHERIARLKSDKFSPTVLKIAWVGFEFLHFVCFVYFAFAGWGYWKLPETRLDAWLALLYIGMGTEYHRMIALVHLSMAIVHATYIVWMIGWSWWKKDVVFAIYNVIKFPANVDGFGEDWSLVAPIKDGIFWTYRAVFTRDGFLGVDGPNFDFVLLCREIVETALQTQQAYRMSLLVPRRELNRGYVALLVLNCWSTALVHSFFRNHATQRRLLALICDCVLYLVSSVGITTVLVAMYIPDFEFKTYGFPLLKWYEDDWRVHAMSEFQMVLVASWGDLAMRFVFALSMLGNLNNIKKLIRARPTKRVRRATHARHRATVVAPFHASLASIKKNFESVDRESLHFWVGKATEIGFFLWGLVVMILHLYAGSIPELPQCKMQVKPWTTSQPFCSLLELNCYDSGFNGTRDEVTTQWSEFDPTTVVRVVVRHCPALELPEKLTEFCGLREFKIYNSTISSWDQEAAISHEFHPMLTTLLLVRVNMTNGEIPIGLHADDFPQSLEDIEFCVTNLRSLPEDLDLKWPQYASIYIEASQFLDVPQSLVRLAPFDLSLSLNPISTIPKELFESESVAYLNFGGTLISELPENVSKLSSSMTDINLSGTNVSFFWSWIDPLVTASPTTPPISAGGTPYCVDIKRIFEERQTNFSIFPQSHTETSILSDASVDNWDILEIAVHCEELDSTWYPLEFEDAYSKIK
ncbi:uncharacterized protein PITG_16170 [Phytophthora infestans T30-4]|uniref:Transmembrane protein n=1 Tax=Phytophthora infestans (strain T30-4) TaxID=403677 RepID=D0NTA6_PHYIT|nr:uncharacterized protein PITG_16170 [Phytophthora infestans T30-4]EEY64857.1 conserved hypothetical protein [Phytophthora infestans T30-4]|eukprot:XP_002897587.1 conserved hypothetical protein [Phytophthora infestans T30-4]